MQFSLRSSKVKISTLSSFVFASFVFVSIVFVLCLSPLANAKDASLVLKEAFGSDPYRFITEHNDLVIVSSQNDGFSNTGGTSIDVFQYTDDGFELLEQHFITQLENVGGVHSIDYMFETNGFLSFVLSAQNGGRYLVSAIINENNENGLRLIDSLLIGYFPVRVASTMGANNHVYIVDPEGSLSLKSYSFSDSGEISLLVENDIDDLFQRNDIFYIDGLHAAYENNAVYLIGDQDDSHSLLYQLDIDSTGAITQTSNVSIVNPQDVYSNLEIENGLVFLDIRYAGVDISEVQGNALVPLDLPDRTPREITSVNSFANYTVIIDGISGVVVYDMSDRDNIVTLSEVVTFGFYKDAILLDNTIIISQASGGISSIGISENGLLSEEHSFSQSGSATDFSLRGDTFAHVAYRDAVHLWDISDDDESQLSTRFTQINGISGVHLREEDLLLINDARVEKHLLDDVIAQQDNGEFLGALDTSGRDGQILALDNGYLVATYEYLKFYSLTLEQVDAFELVRTTFNAYFRQYAYAADNKLFITTNDPRKVFIFDTSDISNVSLISENTLNFPYRMKNNLASKGAILYVPVIDEQRVKVQVVDTGHASGFEPVALLDIEEAPFSGQFVDSATVHVYDDYLVVLGDAGYLFDISEPQNPVLIDTNANVSSNGYAKSFESTIFSVRNKTSGRILRSQINVAPELQTLQMQIQEDIVDDSNTLMLPLRDQEGDLVSYEFTDTNDLVSVSISDTNTLLVTGKPNQNSTTQLNIIATDEHGNIGNLIVNIDIAAVNDAPDISLSSITLDEDVLSINALNATDVEGDTFTMNISSPALFGTAAITEAGELSYMPNADYFGDDSVEITLVDENGGETVRLIPISVMPVNDLPILSGLTTVETSEDNNFQFVLNAVDVESQDVTFSVVSAPEDWVVTIAGSAVSVMPALNDNGEYVIVFSLSDGVGTNQQAFSVKLLPINDAPEIEAFTITVNEDTSFISSLNISDPEDDTTTVEIISPAAFGIAQVDDNQVLSYAPNANYFGTDSVEISISDSEGAQSTLVVPINIAPVNDKPFIQGSRRVEGTEDTSFTIIFDAADVENDPVAISRTFGPGGWEILVDETQTETTATITPAANANGLFEIGFTLYDGRDSNLQIYTINLASQNDAPTVANTTLSENVLQGSAVDGNIEATDVDNDSLSYQVSTPASKGTVTVDEQGNYSYSPNQSELGADSFVVTVSDTSGEEVAVTVSVNINRLPALSIPENNEDEGGGGGSTSPLLLAALLMFIALRRRITISD